MNKRIILLSIGAFLATCVTALSLIINNTQLVKTNSGIPSYGISFSSSKNKFFSGTGSTSHSGDVTIKTDLNNDIDFTYYDLAGGSSSTWHLIKSGGYFYNTTPIHGLSEISFASTSSNKDFKVEWGYNTNYTLGSQMLSSSTSGVTCYFDNESPTFFKITNIGDTNLSFTSINTSLSCLNNYPLVTLLSNDDSMGIVSGDGYKTAGQQITISAMPNQGYRFAGWYNNEMLVSNNQSYTFTIGNEDITYTAHFTYESYNFICESESSDKGSVTNATGSYDYLSQITIEAMPNQGYSFAGWYEGSTLVSNLNPYSFSMPHSDTTYTAKFTPNFYSLTLINANEELGTITGQGTYSYGSQVTVVATPNTGVSFLGWYNNQDIQIASSLSYTFNMPYEDITYTAKFALTQYEMNVSINDKTMGSVTGGGYYTYGQQVNLIATPNEHYSFYGWYNGETLLSQQLDMTFNMPANSLYYEARFVKNYNLIVYSDDESMGSVSSPIEWGAGLEVTVSALANEGYAIDYWADENYDEVAYDTDYTFIMPNHDVELIAVFNNGYTLTVTSSDEGKGTVSDSNYYAAGRQVTVTMNYISGTFKGWFDENGNFVSLSNPYTFSMPSSNYSLQAVFMTKDEEIKYAICPILSEDGKSITYGLYPQINVSDSSLISSLDALTTPESNGWYLFNGDYYAKTIATLGDFDFTVNEFDNGTTIVSGKTYWFKCEPIVWNVLSNNSGEYYILSSVLLDAHCYYNSTSTRTIDGKTIYPNNYEYSDIRTWLNNDFYNSAFALSNSNIMTTTVDNSASTTDSNNNKYACGGTKDNVFLPSYQDYINPNLGFDESTDSSIARHCKTTDWARARGAVTYTAYTLFSGIYWTRSPQSLDSYGLCDITGWGSVTNGSGSIFERIDCPATSVRPAITIKIT